MGGPGAIGIDLMTEPSYHGAGLLIVGVSDTGMREPLIGIPEPAWLEVWPIATDPESMTVHRLGYDTLERSDAHLSAVTVVDLPDATVSLRDVWSRVAADTWRVDREVTAQGTRIPEGVRLRLEMSTAFAEGAGYADLRYFAPPAMYDKNDLDEDGVDDYLGSQSLAYRDDRLNAVSVMAYDPRRGLSLSLIRADTPSFDDDPHRPNRERVFMQRTDIGSMGFGPADGSPAQVRIHAAYPFDEGERSHALLILERPGWGAFWPTSEDPTFAVSYMIRVDRASSFIDAAWRHFARRLRELRPRPVALPASADELLRLRVESLDRYYLESDAQADPNRPAGYVLNCHPQDGVQLADIIQYGFTGQNILNAYLMLRFGDAHDDRELSRRAIRVIEFFVSQGHLPEVGLFYDLYNVPKQKMDCWWTGLLLPLAYAEPGGTLEALMGPLQRRWESEILQLRSLRGSYLRCMAESVHALALAWKYEASQGRSHDDWLAAARRFGEFLVRAQEGDGSWFRAYDHDGLPITLPSIWFGTTRYEQKSSTATAIPLLVELADLTGEERFLEAAVRAGHFVRSTLVDPVRFNGGIHDPIYAKGQLIDNEGILFPMLGLLALFRRVGGDEFRDGAVNAAKLFASWTCLWDVPLPPSSTLARYGFRSTGMGACDTCGAGYVHPFELLAVPELMEIAEISGDRDLFDVAVLTYGGCNQTVAVPGHDWGYAYPGLQEEGYLISWWLIDDPIFDDTAFGHRWKGEGNKTCFPWIPAVGMACHWKLLDRYGTTDATQIRAMVGFAD